MAPQPTLPPPPPPRQQPQPQQPPLAPAQLRSTYAEAPFVVPPMVSVPPSAVSAVPVSQRSMPFELLSIRAPGYRGSYEPSSNDNDETYAELRLNEITGKVEPATEPNLNRDGSFNTMLLRRQISMVLQEESPRCSPRLSPGRRSFRSPNRSSQNTTSRSCLSELR